MTTAETELGELADELNSVLNHANSVIRALDFGVFASVALYENVSLGFGKVENRWCLHLLVGATPNDLLSGSIRQRMEAAAAIPALVEQLKVNQADNIRRLKDILFALRTFLTALEEEL